MIYKYEQATVRTEDKLKVMNNWGRDGWRAVDFVYSTLMLQDIVTITFELAVA